MQYIEWRGTWQSPMVRKQGRRGEGGENAFLTENALEEEGDEFYVQQTPHVAQVSRPHPPEWESEITPHL